MGCGGSPYHWPGFQTRDKSSPTRKPRLEAKLSQLVLGQEYWGEIIRCKGGQRAQKNRWINGSRKLNGCIAQEVDEWERIGV